MCCRCKLLKPLFYKDKRATDGLYSHCSDCEKISQVKRKDRIKITRAANFQKNKVTRLAQNKQYAQEHKEEMREYRKRWRKDNKAHCAALRAKYRAAKAKATPLWLSESHLKEILNIYLNCPKGHEVDHWIPLQGDNVSGLHVPWNLRAIPRADNRSKGNKLVVD